MKFQKFEEVAKEHMRIFEIFMNRKIWKFSPITSNKLDQLVLSISFYEKQNFHPLILTSRPWTSLFTAPTIKETHTNLGHDRFQASLKNNLECLSTKFTYNWAKKKRPRKSALLSHLTLLRGLIYQF